jgi:hypothetical protein
MSCVHLRKLYQLCQQEGLKLAGPDLIHIVCEQCGEKEVCPSLMYDQYEALEQRQQASEAGQAAAQTAAAQAVAAQTVAAQTVAAQTVAAQAVAAQSPPSQQTSSL